jgi:UDP:flavonoid glycosyltransferase YjiC (YdhE family)
VSRVACLVVGTRGDLVPVIALAQGLRTAGHDPVIATSLDHRALVESHGLPFSPLRPSYAEGIAEAGDELGRGTGAGLLRARMVEASRSWAEDGARAVERADLIIGVATVMGALADALGEAHRIPVAHAHLMPLIPTRHIPPPLPPPGRRTLPGPANLALFRAMRLLVWRACFADAISRVRATLNLRPLPWAPRDPAAPVLCAWSPSLLPQPPDWPTTRIRVTGIWAPPASTPAPSDPALVRFVEAGDPPIHAGFGSMQVAPDQRERVARAIQAGIRLSGRRAIIGGDLLSCIPHGSDIHPAGSASYGWLFPRVACVLHHGGSGATHDAARAGVPQIVMPFVVDQFLWAQRLHAAGVAPWRLDRKRLTADAVARAIEQSCRSSDAAQALAGRLRPEDGVGGAIAALQAWRLLG